MRIALLLLAVIACIFVGSIMYMVMPISSRWANIWPVSTSQSSLDAANIEIIKSLQKIQDRLDTIESKWGDTADIRKDIPKSLDIRTVGTGTSSTGSTLPTKSEQIDKKDIPLSGKFLEKVLPVFTLKLIPNTWILWLLIFEKIPYSTYRDEKLGITIWAVQSDYDVMLKNMKAVSSTVYTVNEYKGFPFASAYINTPKPDGMVRILMKYETQTIVMEMTKIRYAAVKTMLLKK